MSTLLDIKDLEVAYPGKGFRAKPFQALKGVSLDIRPGETVGLVGESGSGKTTLGRAVLGLAPVTAGSIHYDGRSIAHLNRKQRRDLASEIQVVFQDPYSSLNPSLTIEQILAEPLTARGVAGKDAKAIARALALDPRLIVCDEPVSALDLSTQARVLDLFIEIQERTGVAYLFVTHDLAVVRHISHRVAVMYRGEIVETGDGDRVTSRPEHPYTQRLFMASPVPDPDKQEQRRIARRTLLDAEATA
jgi:ABC-type glutathione transport system ATPase component